MFEGEEGQKRPRDRRKVRDQVAEQVVGFANAEGFVLQHDGHTLIVFDVPNCDVPVRVEGDGFPLRIGDKTMQVSESHIQKLEFRGLVESWESRPSHLRLADLDPALLERARRGAGLIALADEEYLVKRKLADHRGRDLVLRQGAELLFGKSGPDHPNAGFRLFRVVGSERKVGAEHNVEERPRFEGNLPTVIEECFSAIEGILRRPARLVGHRFRTVSEYPEFSWKEAIVNAAAHRDYNVEGRTTEIWFFDDRLEVVSPGGLLPDVNLEELLALHRIHVSRNPRTVRVLVDLGIVRDQGEGIPRMFAEMEGFFLPAPVLDSRDHLFRVTLRNTATLTADDKSFVARLGDAELTDVEFRALLEAHRAGRLDNARLRAISGLDTLGASALLRRLRDRELLALHAAGPNSYYELGPKAQLPIDARGVEADRPERTSDRPGSGPDRPELTADRPESEADRPELPPDLAVAVKALGTRPRQGPLRDAIALLCTWRPLKPAELGAILGIRADNLTKRHLTEMVAEGRLRRLFPDEPTHPNQAYAAASDNGENSPT